MKAKTVQIHWHEKNPIFSLDFQPVYPYKLATAGADFMARVSLIFQWAQIWKVDCPENLGDDSDPQNSLNIEHLASLNRHSQTVNCVRWSPNGEYLATAGDDGIIMIWKEQNEGFSRKASTAFGGDSVAQEDEKESWYPIKLLMNPQNAAIFDLAWSPCGSYVISASDMDNCARIWDIETRKIVHTILDHQHFVQGVCWDPRGNYLATQSSDRSMNIYSIMKTDLNTLSFSSLVKSSKIPTSSIHPPEQAVEADKENTIQSSQPVSASGAPLGNKKNQRLFQDENVVNFFRRLTFSPDGNLLIAPSGIWKPDINNPSETEYVAWVYARNQFKRGPIAFYPGMKKSTTVVKFCRTKFEKLPNLTESVIDLPYRMIFALASQDSVFIYDTQQAEPIVQLSNLHYHHVTDVSWLSDARALMISSSDGFCSIACFNENELGTPLKMENVESELITQKHFHMASLQVNTLQPKRIDPPTVHN